MNLINFAFVCFVIYGIILMMLKKQQKIKVDVLKYTIIMTAITCIIIHHYKNNYSEEQILSSKFQV